jgi:hypothetical protein
MFSASSSVASTAGRLDRGFYLGRSRKNLDPTMTEIRSLLDTLHTVENLRRCALLVSLGGASKTIFSHYERRQKSRTNRGRGGAHSHGRPAKRATRTSCSNSLSRSLTNTTKRNGESYARFDSWVGNDPIRTSQIILECAAQIWSIDLDGSSVNPVFGYAQNSENF